MKARLQNNYLGTVKSALKIEQYQGFENRVS